MEGIRETAGSNTSQTVPITTSDAMKYNVPRWITPEVVGRDGFTVSKAPPYLPLAASRALAASGKTRVYMSQAMNRVKTRFNPWPTT